MDIAPDEFSSTSSIPDETRIFTLFGPDDTTFVFVGCGIAVGVDVLVTVGGIGEDVAVAVNGIWVEVKVGEMVAVNEGNTMGVGENSVGMDVGRVAVGSGNVAVGSGSIAVGVACPADREITPSNFPKSTVTVPCSNVLVQIFPLQA